MPAQRKRIFDCYSATSTPPKSTKCANNGTHAPLREFLKKNFDKKLNQDSSKDEIKITKKNIESYDSVISVHKEALELLDIRNCDYSIGRESEVEILQNKIESLLKKKSGGFIHVSGLSGVGKTCVVNHVSKLLCDNPKYTSNLANEIIKIKCANHGNKILENLSEFLKDSKPRKKPGNNKSFREQSEQLKTAFKEQEKLQICILDEIDFLDSSGTKRLDISDLDSSGTKMLDISDRRNNKHNDYIKSILDASKAPESKVIILAISNSMNLIDIKALNGNNIVFPPYNEKQLSNIIWHKLSPLGKNVFLIFEENSLQLINRRVSNHNGDVRTCLSTFRKAVETSLYTLNEARRKLVLKTQDLKTSSAESANKDLKSFEQSDLKLNLQSFNNISNLNKASLTEKVLESPSNTDIPSICSQETAASETDLLTRTDPSYVGGFNSSCSQSSDEFYQTDSLDRNTLFDFCNNDSTENPQERTESFEGNASATINGEESNLSKECDEASQFSTCIDSEDLAFTFHNRSQAYKEITKDLCHYPSNDENFDSHSQSSRNFHCTFDSLSQACNYSHEFGTESSPDSSSRDQSIYQGINMEFDNILDLEQHVQIDFLTNTSSYTRIGVAALNRVTIPNNNQHIEYLITQTRNLTVMKALYLRALLQAAIDKINSKGSNNPRIPTESLTTNLEISMEDVYNCYRELFGSTAPIVKMSGSSFKQALEEFADAGFCSIKQPETKSNKGNVFQRNNLNCVGSSRGYKIVISLPISLINSLISFLNIDLENIDLPKHFAYGLEN